MIAHSVKDVFINLVWKKYMEEKNLNIVIGAEQIMLLFWENLFVKNVGKKLDIPKKILLQILFRHNI